MTQPNLLRTQRRAVLDVRRRMGKIRMSNYDISNTCNLTCEGCLYFASETELPQETDQTDADWEELFQREAERGVNFAYVAGAEPSLVPQRIRAAQRHIPNGVVFTNGTKRLPDDIRYRIHVSIWGLGEDSAMLRGADVTGKAMRNYAGDPRAVFTYTINALNIGDVVEAARLCHAHGITLTYSYFSATDSYNDFLSQDGDGPGREDDYHRVGRQDFDPRHTPETLAAARAAIVEAMERFPDTVRYSLHYNDWISRPTNELWRFDENDIAIDCGNRLSKQQRHYAADTSLHSGKCCSPNIDCRDCRAYAMGMATYLARHGEFKSSPDDLAQWTAAAILWADLFLPLKVDTAQKAAE